MKTSPDPNEVYTAMGWLNEMCGSQEKGWTFVPTPGNGEPPGPQLVRMSGRIPCDSRNMEGRLSSFQPMSCGSKAMLGSPTTAVTHPPHSSTWFLPDGFVSGFALVLYSIFSSIDETVRQIISILRSDATRPPHWNETLALVPAKPYVIAVS